MINLIPFMLKVVAVENKTTKFGNISCLKNQTLRNEWENF